MFDFAETFTETFVESVISVPETIYDIGSGVLPTPVPPNESIPIIIDGGEDAISEIADDVDDFLEKNLGWSILQNILGNDFVSTCETVFGKDYPLCMMVKLWNQFEEITVNAIFSSPLLLYIFSILYPLHGIASLTV